MTRFLTSLLFGVLAALSLACAALAGTIQVAVIPATISQEGQSFVIDPEGKTSVGLIFDMSMLPKGVEIARASLRIVPMGSSSGSQFVRIFETGKTDVSIGSLSVGTGPQPVTSTGSGLAKVLATSGASLNLTLSTDSVRVSRSYASDQAPISSMRPRLIVEWQDNAPDQTRQGALLAYRGAPEDASPWKYGKASGAVLTQVFTARQILTGPVFVGEDIVLVADTGAGAKLVGISPLGVTRWSFPEQGVLPGSTWKYLRVDAQGRLLAFRNDGVMTVFDGFGAKGPTTSTDHPVPDLRVSKRPVVSAGGMITFLGDKKGDQDLGNYVYSYSPLPNVTPLWRSDQTVGMATAPVLSPRMGDHLVYAIVDGQAKGLAVFNAATGALGFPSDGGTGFPAGSDLGKFSQYHPVLPVVARNGGAAQEWAYLSGYGDTTGSLEGYADLTAQGAPARWANPQSGAMSRCISPPATAGATPRLYCEQDKTLRAYAFDSGKEICRSDPKVGDLNPTSNLLSDGAGNIFFWQEDTASSGALHGFDKDCKWLFSAPLGGVPARTDGIEVLELRMGPNGVIYLVETTKLLAIRVVDPVDRAIGGLNANTQYSVNGTLTIDNASAPVDGPVALYAAKDLALANMVMPKGAEVVCAARGGISFGPGFAVEKGAALRCGFDTSQAPD